MTTTGDVRNGARGGPWWWERRRAAVFDVGLAVASGVECAVEGVPFAHDAGVPAAVGAVFGLLVGSVLVFRRKWPIPVVLVAIAVAPAQMGFLMGVVGLYTLAACELPRRVIGALAGMSLVGTLVVAFVRLGQGSHGGDPTMGDWFVPFAAVTTSLGLTAPPVLLGLYVGARRRLMESLRERADSLERELQLLAERAEERAEWARNEERTRIAREMHDVVAHRVSLMVVHAAALQAVARKDPDKAVRNAALVGDMGRQALTELREMLGVLRSGDAAAGAYGGVSGGGVDGGVGRVADEGGGRAAGRAVAGAGSSSGSGSGAGSGSGSGFGSESESGAGSRPGGGSGAGSRPGDGPGARPVPEVPLAAVGAAAAAAARRDAVGAEVVGEGFEGPSLADLRELVGQSAAAGMAVDLSVEGDARVYAPQVEQTAFRVVQEALTNVHKHAAGAKTYVRLAHRSAEVAMQVENEPPPEPASASAAGLPSGGNGLVGMRERVSALGGVFVSGPTEAGGFRVSAVIPAA